MTESLSYTSDNLERFEKLFLQLKSLERKTDVGMGSHITPKIMTSHGMLEFVIFDPAQGEWPYTRSVLETSDPKAHYARSYDFMDIPKDKRNERRILGSETGLSILETLFDEYITVHGREG